MAAPGASAASRWLLPELLERRDGRSQSLWGLEAAAPRAFGASRSLVPEPLGPRNGCSQSLWSFQEPAPRASGDHRWLLPRGNCRGDSRRSFEALRRPLARKHSVISAATNQQVNILSGPRKLPRRFFIVSWNLASVRFFIVSCA